METTSTEAKPRKETQKNSTSDRKKSSREPEVEQTSKNNIDLNDNRRDDRRPKKTAPKKKTKIVNQHDDRVEVETFSESPEIEPAVEQTYKNDLHDNRRDDRRPKKASSKKKSKVVNQHDDRVEVETNSRTESPQIDKRVTRSMAKKQEPRHKIEDEQVQPNRREQKSPKPKKLPKSELESMQDGLDRLVIVNRNAKLKPNRNDSNRNDDRDSKPPRKSTDRKPAKVTKELSEKKELKQAVPGHSKWFPGDTRPDWTRPCFKDFDHVIIGDSQLKIYGQQKKQKNGFSITSFSGCDVSLAQCFSDII